MGCSCNKNVNRSNTTAKRQISRPRPARNIVRATNNNTARVIRRVLDRY